MPPEQYADVELTLVPLIKAEFDVRAVTELPADLDDVLPVVQVVRFGDGADEPTLDRALIDVDVYAATRKASSDLARRLHYWLRHVLPGHRDSDGTTIRRVVTVTAPSWRPYDNTALRRTGATYRITVKSRL